MQPRFTLPALGFGAGLRAPHYEAFVAERPALGWLEIISENFLHAHAGYKDFLADLRQDYAFVMHGVSLSIGSTDPLDRAYLARLKALADFLQPAWVSDHLCFTGVMGKNTHDLLPVPYTEEALTHIAARIRTVQDVLERPLVLENPSSYVAFAGSTLPEAEFLAELAREADCALLLDINNVHVSAHNQGMDAERYLDTLPPERIVQFHLAGHTDYGDYKLDTHDRAVTEEVWQLYARTVARIGHRATMVEWDERIPPLSALLEEVEKARRIAAPSREAA